MAGNPTALTVITRRVVKKKKILIPGRFQTSRSTCRSTQNYCHQYDGCINFEGVGYCTKEVNEFCVIVIVM